MKKTLAAATTLGLGWLLVWAAPLTGLALAGEPLAPYLAFPPRTAAETHAPFSWTAFFLFSLPLLASVALYAVALIRADPRADPVVRRAFPWWGWLGVALIGAGWALAWGDVVAPAWRRIGSSEMPCSRSTSCCARS